MLELKCEYCKIDFSTKAGIDSHTQSCFYKENPLPKVEEAELEKPKKKTRKTTTDKKVGK